MYMLDILYTYAYKNSIPRNKVSYLLSINNKKIDYVFLGSSRVDNNIVTKIIENETGKSAINLGVQGAKLDDYFLMLQLLKKQNIKTRKVFIQVDYVYNIEGSSDILKSYLLPYINDDLISKFIEERDSDFFRLKYFPFYRYLTYDYKLGFREFFNSIMKNKSKTNFEDGYFPKYGSQGNKLGASLPKTIVFENKTIKAIDKFAKENNIKIIYFMAPFCNNTTNKDFSAKLKVKIPDLWDYSQLFSEDNYFFNCTHLNNEGAKEFSKRIAFDILKQHTNNLNKEIN